MILLFYCIRYLFTKCHILRSETQDYFYDKIMLWKNKDSDSKVLGRWKSLDFGRIWIFNPDINYNIYAMCRSTRTTPKRLVNLNSLTFLYFLRFFSPFPLCKNVFLQVTGPWWSEDVSTGWQCSRGVAARTPRISSSPPMSLQRPASSAWADRKGGVGSLTSNLCLTPISVSRPLICAYTPTGYIYVPDP